jgi:hypothetical protein
MRATFNIFLYFVLFFTAILSANGIVHALSVEKLSTCEPFELEAIQEEFLSGFNKDREKITQEINEEEMKNRMPSGCL